MGARSGLGLAFLASIGCAMAACAGEGTDPLARLQGLQRIEDWPAAEKEARALLKNPLTPPQRVSVWKALFDATEGDSRLALLQELPGDFPEEEGLKLHVRAIQDSRAYRSLDFYRLLAARYPKRLAADLVDEAARPLLNERRDWVAGAEAVAKAGLERFPANSKLLDILADVYRRTLREKESLELQRQAVANAPTPDLKKQMLEQLIRNLTLQGKTDEALDVRREILREWPDHDWARQTLDGLAIHYLRAESVAKGLDVYDAYIQAYPKGKWVEHCYLRRPFLYQLDGKYDQAAEETRRILPSVGERTRENLKRDLAGLPTIEGRVLDPKGRPISGATVALARRSPIREEENLIVARTQADAKGHYEFHNLPFRERYEFLAATKPDHPVTGLSTTFGPQGFPLELGDRKTFDIRFGRAPLTRLPGPEPPAPTFDDGVPRRLLRSFVLRDWTDAPWPRSPLHYAVDLPRRVTASSLRLVDLTGQPVAFQFTPESGRAGTLTFFAGLPAHGAVAFSLFGCDEETKRTLVETQFQIRPCRGNEIDVSTGPAAFRVPGPPGERRDSPRHVQATLPPVIAVQGPDRVWRGRGEFIGKGRVEGLDAQWIESGPLRRQLRLTYRFEGGGTYEATLTFHSGEPYVLINEKSTGLPVEFRFSAHAGFAPDRVALCWINRLHVESIACTKPRRLIQMLRYVMWAPEGEGDAAGFFHSAPDRKDLLTVFTVHPGNWIVQSQERWRAETFQVCGGATLKLLLERVFRKHAQARTWAWHPESSGDRSRWSGDPKAGGRDSIEAWEDKDEAYFSFPLFAGERQWGLAVTDKENAVNRCADLRTYVGECTLDWYKDLILDWDEEPLESHPRLAVARNRLAEVARTLQSSPLLRLIFEPRRVQWFQSIVYDRPDPAMEFLLTGDPARGWEGRNVCPDMRIIRGVRAGKMRGNLFSPVGVRCCSFYSADAYDALVNSNAIDPWTLRVLRARMMFLAYALMGPDFMAWRYHAGHRNFDFSRFDVTASYGLLFPTHPDSRRFVEHAVNQFRESLQAFTAEESGKWQENLGCYYLWSLRTAAGMNTRLLNSRWNEAGGPRLFGFPLAPLGSGLRPYSLVSRPLSLLGRWPRLFVNSPFDWHKYQLFLEFAIKCVTPEHPLDNRLCIDGLKDGQSYDQVPRGRRIPGVGDHGGEGGTPVADGIGLSGILAERMGHRALAGDLLGAWRAGGYMREGQAGIDLRGMLAANLDPRAAERAVMRPRSSENLPEYGFCFRADWGTPRETFLLFKCGRGGYRYHFSEGSFVLYANNRPLSVDGDENFVPARHATISIGPQCGYVGNGIIERHFLHPVADYCRGVFAGSRITRSILFVKNDYVVIRDDLFVNRGDEPTNFHLPLLVHKIERRNDHFFCPGRLGTDVLLYPLAVPRPASPTVSSARLDKPAVALWPKVDIKTDPLLNQQLITMTRKKGDAHLNLIRWTEPGGQPLKITPVGSGYRIEGPDFVDHLFFAAEPVQFQAGELAFDGRVGLIRQKAGQVSLLLLDGTRIAFGSSELTSPEGRPRAR